MFVYVKNVALQALQDQDAAILKSGNSRVSIFLKKKKKKIKS